MSSSIHSPSNFPYHVLPFELCGIINDYLCCGSETREALSLQSSQSSESLNKQENQALKNIWKIFAENISPQNSILEEWTKKCSFFSETNIEGRFYSIEMLIREYIESKMGATGTGRLALINEQFPGRHLNLSKCRALADEMDAAIEFDALKKITLCIAATIGPIFVESAKPLDSQDKIMRWIKENQDSLDEILRLDLSREELGVIPPSFSDISMPNLRFINLSYNKLSALPSDFGKDWIDLCEIRLNDNKLCTLPEGFGNNWQELSILSLAGNQLSSLPDEFGKGWQKLEKFYLSENPVKALPPEFGINWVMLKKIWLNKNLLEDLPRDFGQSWEGLKEIWLCQNQIRTLPLTFGENWAQLEEIWLNNNSLQDLPLDFGSNWQILRYILLQHNQIQALPTGFGDKWPLLKEVYLNDNKIQSLPNKFGEAWSSLNKIYLIHNPHLKERDLRFGANWPERAQVHTDEWFKTETAEGKHTHETACSSQSFCEDSPMEEEEKSSYQEVAQLSIQESAVGTKRALEQTALEVAEEQNGKKPKR